ncbi:MAG: sporulation protein YhbH [Chloroflexota bacterium]|nr:MAG: sporulation protein YhbH [Chloroflexota bacterium]
MSATISLSQSDWSLHRKGPADQARHAEKVKEAIRGNLADIVAEESIITSDGHSIVKVPIRSLDHPRFRYDPYGGEGAGQGDGKSKVGDVLGRLPQQEQGAGKKAGNEPGVDYYEAEITVDELSELIFADLGLPALKPKASSEVESEQVVYNDIRRKGIFSNLDKKRTIMENIRRNALTGTPGFRNVNTDDLRFKTWTHEVRRESRAVIMAMRDVSGSMGEFEKYITRSFYFWMVRFLRQKYDNVQIVFITHHTEAKEVDEDAFFQLGESGGTRVSSAYRLALELVEGRYSPELWNIYGFHFSDGDNWGDSDNRTCLELVQKLLESCNLFGYGEIMEGGRGWSSRLMSTLEQIRDDKFVGVVIAEKQDVYPALQKFFARRD